MIDLEPDVQTRLVRAAIEALEALVLARALLSTNTSRAEIDSAFHELEAVLAECGDEAA